MKINIIDGTINALKITISRSNVFPSNQSTSGMDERDTLARIRFAAQMTRNSSPPHCRPITILILIMALGTMFIGMTMTIVAHWPGSVSVGFDPLSSPGPIILALGGIALIFGSILVCYFQRAEQKKKGEKFVSFATTLSRA